MQQRQILLNRQDQAGKSEAWEAGKDDRGLLSRSLWQLKELMAADETFGEEKADLSCSKTGSRGIAELMLIRQP